MRAEFVLGVTVGRDGAAPGRVVPVKAQLDRPHPKHAADKPPIGAAGQLVNKCPPGRGKLEARTILQPIAVMTQLPVGAFDPKQRGEVRHLGQAVQQALIAIRGEQPGWIDPRVGGLSLKRSRVKGAEPVTIKIGHGAA